MRRGFPGWQAPCSRTGREERRVLGAEHLLFAWSAVALTVFVLTKLR